MSNITGQQPGQDLPDPILLGSGGKDAIARPDEQPGIGNDLPTKPASSNPASEPDLTMPNPAVLGDI